jgi:hypothetical protein
VQTAFALHHVGHANARIVHGSPIDPGGIDVVRDLAKPD